jgi:hypothetical protein
MELRMPYLLDPFIHCHIQYKKWEEQFYKRITNSVKMGALLHITPTLEASGRETEAMIPGKYRLRRQSHSKSESISPPL